MKNHLQMINPTKMELLILEDIIYQFDQKLTCIQDGRGNLYDIYILADGIPTEDNEYNIIEYNDETAAWMAIDPKPQPQEPIDEFAEYAARQCTGDGIEPYGHTPPC